MLPSVKLDRAADRDTSLDGVSGLHGVWESVTMGVWLQAVPTEGHFLESEQALDACGGPLELCLHLMLKGDL